MKSPEPSFDLPAVLEAYRLGEAEIDEVHAALDALVARFPGRVGAALQALEAARAAGLSERRHAQLKQRLISAAANAASIPRKPHRAFDADTTDMGGVGLADDEPTELNPTAGGDAGDGHAQAGHPDEGAEEEREDDEDTIDPLLTDMSMAFSGEEPTGTYWPRPKDGEPRPGVHGEREFQRGDVLRSRFELVAKLGEGGMGSVWKGKDLLKEEAKDRNPYVAIKLLQADFKKHPEAFIALQRETSKQQRLAHPNIATVYDFDRDEKTQTVFMTMEVMEGKPLDAFIRELSPDGLPERDAMAIIEQLAAGLAYAHDNGLVHSDLKPGNCFVTSGGNVKLLDFGIARASTAKGEVEGETTLFDPAELGALTPTYATVEMFDGQAPDPRDDIFALAILAYQLLTGRHPYAKKSAPKAKELGLRPTPVAKLGKRQNRALARGLALDREKRTTSVEEFLDGIRRKHSIAAYYTSGALAASLLIAVLAYKPALDLLDEYRREDIIATLSEPGFQNIRIALDHASALGDEELARILDDERTKRAVIAHIAQAEGERLDQWLRLIGRFDPKWKRDIVDHERARESIVEHFDQLVLEAFDPAGGRFDREAADRYLKDLDRLYPDSTIVLDIREKMAKRQERALARLEERLDRALGAGKLLPTSDGQDVGSILRRVRRLDPDNSLLSNPMVPETYVAHAQGALAARDLERAQALVLAGLELWPRDAKLVDLRFEVESELEQVENRKRSADIEARLGEALAGYETLEDFRRAREELRALAELNPQSPVLARARAALEGVLDREIDGLLAAERPRRVAGLLLEHAPLLSIDYLGGARRRLVASAGAPIVPAAPRGAAADRVERIEALLREPRENTAWESTLERFYKELLALLAPHDETLRAIRERIAAHYLHRTRAAREAESFSEARAILARGRRFHPGFPPFVAETRAIAEDTARLAARRAAKRQRAYLESLKEDFRGKATTDQVREAKQLLSTLRSQGLSPDDPFLRDEAPRLLAGAYRRLADVRERRGDVAGALTLTRAAQELVPDDPDLRERVTRLEARRLAAEMQARFAEAALLDVAEARESLEKLRRGLPRSRYEALLDDLAERRTAPMRELAGTASAGGRDDLRTRMEEFAALFPDRSAALTDEMAGLAERRILAAVPATPSDVKTLSVALGHAQSLFPERNGHLRRALGESLTDTIRMKARREPGEARAMLAAARGLLPESDALAAVAAELPPPELAEARAHLEAGELSAAAERLALAEARAPGHPRVAELRGRLEDSRKRARSAYADYLAAVASAKPSEQAALDALYEEIAGGWRDNSEFERQIIAAPRKGECVPGLAGFGARTGGSCYDLVADRKGPEMVVVPPGEGIDTPFAIGKYEVSVEEFNLYCARTGRCRARDGNVQLPVTRISLEEAEAYARWLTEEASKEAGEPVRYRLPTALEWRHAAQADGEQPEKQFNCRVVSSGEVIKGHALLETTSGIPNGWGLANYAGNAREWARSGGGLEVRGGAYEDPLTRCGPDFSERHEGEPDTLTGFRLVRDLG